MGPMKSALDMRQSRSLQGGMVCRVEMVPRLERQKRGGDSVVPEQGAGLRPPVCVGEGVRSP